MRHGTFYGDEHVSCNLYCLIAFKLLPSFQHCKRKKNKINLELFEKKRTISDLMLQKREYFKCLRLILRTFVNAEEMS